MVNFKLGNYDDFDSVDPSSMGGYGFDSCCGLRIFLCPTLVSC